MMRTDSSSKCRREHIPLVVGRQSPLRHLRRGHPGAVFRSRIHCYELISSQSVHKYTSIRIELSIGSKYYPFPAWDASGQ